MFVSLTKRSQSGYISKYESITDNVKVSRWVYQDLTHSDSVLHKLANVWENRLDPAMLDTSNLRRCFKNIAKYSISVKLRDFQFRFLHNKIFCNDILVHWRKVDSHLCNFCKIEKQTIRHLMFECSKIRPIWMRLQAKLKRFSLSGEFNFSTIITNTVCPDSNDIINTIVLICKQFIYRCKCQDVTPVYNSVLAEIQLNYRIELYNVCKMNNVVKVKKRWSPVISPLKLTVE